MTGKDLVRLWVSRDIRYRKFGTRLTTVQYGVVQFWRGQELHEAIEPGLSEARLIHGSWTPPFGLERNADLATERTRSQAHRVTSLSGTT